MRTLFLRFLLLAMAVGCGGPKEPEGAVVGDDDDDDDDDDVVGYSDVEPFRTDLPVDIASDVPMSTVAATSHFVEGNLTVYLALQNDSGEMYTFPQVYVDVLDGSGEVLATEEVYLMSTEDGYYQAPGGVSQSVIWYLGTRVMPSSLAVRALQLDEREDTPPETEIRSVDFGNPASPDGWLEAEVCRTAGSERTEVALICDVVDGDDLGYWNLCRAEAELESGEDCALLRVEDLLLPADPAFLVYPWH